MFVAFLRAGVKEVDAPTDMALTTVLYQAAAKHRVKYIINGHSFRTEGVARVIISTDTPAHWNSLTLDNINNFLYNNPSIANINYFLDEEWKSNQEKIKNFKVKQHD